MKHTNFILIVLASCFFFFGCKDDNPVTPKVTLVASVNEIDFGVVQTGKEKTSVLTIENTSKTKATVNLSISGADQSSFSLIDNATFSIDGGKSTSISVKFNPTTSKKHTATLIIDFGEKINIILTGESTESVELEVKPAFLNFGVLTLGNSKVLGFEILNKTSSNYSLSLEISGEGASAFSVIKQPTSAIPSGKSDSVIIRFLPGEVKIYQATITFDADKKYSASIQGEGTGSGKLNFNPDFLDFGQIEKLKTKTLKVTLQNLGQLPVVLSPLIEGTDNKAFSINYKPISSLDPGKIDSIKISFTPDDVKNYTAVLYLDNEKTHSVNLKGEGIALVDLELDKKLLDFGLVQINSSLELEIELTNKIISPVTVFASVTSGKSDFSVSSQLPLTILAGSSAKMKVKFSPTEIRKYGDKLEITTDFQSKYSVTLSGEGKSPDSFTLVANSTLKPPDMDGYDIDACWKDAKEISFVLEQVEQTHPDKRKINGSIKATYDNNYIYFLVKIKDDSRDDMPNQFTFKGGDRLKEENWQFEYNGQDGFSFIFPMTSNVMGDKAGETFDKIGCWTCCHTTATFNNFEGGSYPKTGTVDIWYWKAGTSGPQGFADDYYAMGSDGKYPNERKGDVAGRTFEDPNYPPQGAGEIIPISVAGGDNGGIDKTRFIWDETSDNFKLVNNNPATNLPWAAGDQVPGWKLRVQNNEFSSRGDIEARAIYNYGWTIEFKRKLKTDNGSQDDVEFIKGKDIPFSIAYFDAARKFSEFEYINLQSLPRPGHWGTNPPVILLQLK